MQSRRVNPAVCPCVSCCVHLLYNPSITVRAGLQRLTPTPLVANHREPRLIDLMAMYSTYGFLATHALSLSSICLDQPKLCLPSVWELFAHGSVIPAHVPRRVETMRNDG